MPDVDSWLGDIQPLATWRGQEERAHDTARIIADKSSSITVIRAGVALDAQTVRVDLVNLGNTNRERFGEASSAGAMVAQITGYKGHPTITDTDLQRGDQFKVGDTSLRVMMVYPGYSDRLLAVAEVIR